MRVSNLAATGPSRARRLLSAMTDKKLVTVLSALTEEAKVSTIVFLSEAERAGLERIASSLESLAKRVLRAERDALAAGRALDFAAAV